MKVLEERIRQEGLILSETVLKVDSFLNHQVDTALALAIGKEFAAVFGDRQITKVLTVEASGIQFAMAAGIALGVPFIYAKKKKAVTLSEAVYSAPVHSFTRQEDYQISISQKYLGPDDTVLIVDDFLATGAALVGLCDIVAESGRSWPGSAVSSRRASRRDAVCWSSAEFRCIPWHGLLPCRRVRFIS